MRKGTGLAVATGVLAMAVGLGIALSRPTTPSAPEQVTRPARESTGFVLAAPSPRTDGDLRIRGVVLGGGGPLAGVHVFATRPQPGQTLSELSCGEVLQRREWRQKLPNCMNEAASAVVDFVLGREGEAPTYAETSTTEDGTFSLDGLPSGSFALWAVDARGASMWPDVAAGKEGLTLTLGEGLTLEGTVSSEDGALLAGARVTAVHTEHTRFFDTESGADGRYRLGPLPLASYRVAVSKEGWTPELAQGTEHEQVVLDRPRRLIGRVLSNGRPTPDVQVRAELWPELDDGKQNGVHPDRLTTTDAEGRFTFDGLWSSSAYLLTATRGGQHASLQVEQEAFPPEVILELGSALLVEGTVRDEAGHPVSGAFVAGKGYEASTDAEGHYRLGPMEPGPISVRVSASRYRGDSQRVESGPGNVRVDFTLAATVPIEGVVVDDEGHPEANAVLKLEQYVEDGDGETYSVGFTISDEEGLFRMEAPAPGAFNLDVRTGDELIREQQLVTAPSSNVRVVLPRKTRVSGTLTDERDAPIPGARVELWREGQSVRSMYLDTTDARGHFSIRSLEQGRFVLEATHVSGGVERSTSRPIELREREAVEVSLRLEAGWTLTGLAVDETGQPVAGVSVHTRLPQGATPAWRRGDEFGGLPPFTLTGADGRFTLRHLQTEEVWLEVLANGLRFAPSRSEGGQPELKRLLVRAGAPEVRLVLEHLGRIHGRLTGPDGAPLTRFSLNGKEAADPHGVFSRPIETSGTWRMEFTAKGMATVLREVEAQAGTDVDLGEIRLGAGRRVSGRVLDAETGEPLEGVSVLATRARISTVPIERHRGAVTTDADGNFSLPSVEPGPLQLFVEADHYRSQRLDLGAGDEEGLTVRLDQGASVEVSVRDAQGKPMDANLYLDRRGEPLTMRPYSIPNGSGIHRGLEPGSYRVYAFAPGIRRGSTVFDPQDVQLPASGQVKLDLVARSTGATLELRVDDSVRFSILFPGVAPAPRLFRDFPPVEARAFPYEGVLPGTVTYRNLPPGRATLFLVERSLQAFHREEIDLPAEGHLVREVTPAWQLFVFDGF
ncbi:carboxypeptidase regulatory-like domain-containing protein [Pyxidicoccus sp. MSG2]|uniref:carboxypeptidase regulatory-like domain-containing protein n=1 Tax=Pyxidicoccus sp. MSG2 TaxID=2996790 RepID=UPI00226E57C4|nr:carboxypeptidase regulatory-like domain-containing protein [Pyxidicoccus sp. MSG2]MCY1018007.1 carboxypeptidase regulatory-like domain-containing protein [Pyxidicoccus sp. MSG2]